VRVMIATIEHTRVCSKPYKIGAIMHVCSDHLVDFFPRRARVHTHARSHFHRTCTHSRVASRNFFPREATRNGAAITVESDIATRRIGYDAATQFISLNTSRAAKRGVRSRAKGAAVVQRVRSARDHRSCISQGARRPAQSRIRLNAAADAPQPLGSRRALNADAPRTSLASHNRRASGAATYLRLIGRLPVSAVPCDRNAGGVTQWDTASRREPSPGAT